jgi:hypothetical protein
MIFRPFLSFLVAMVLSLVLAGCGGSDSASTAAPGVIATPGNAQVTLAWQPVAGALSYTVYWSTSPGVNPATSAQIASATSPYTISGLTNATTYYFVVSTTYASRTPTVSDPISAVPNRTISIVQTGNNVFSLIASGLDAPSGFDLTLSYDTTRLTNPRVAPGDLASGALLVSNVALPGTVHLAVVRHSAMPGNGIIATFTFDRIGMSVGAIGLSGSVINENGERQPVIFHALPLPEKYPSGDSGATSVIVIPEIGPNFQIGEPTVTFVPATQ